jgi:purine-binding chemotaxis protein CheW
MATQAKIETKTEANFMQQNSTQKNATQKIHSLQKDGWAQRRVAAPQVTTVQYLMFNLDKETFATPIQSIREIIEHQNMTKVPLTPEFLSGVINLRGAVVPVLDLSARFGRMKTQIGRRTCIVIVDAQVNEQYYQIGVIVDGVTEVLEVELDKVETPPDFGLGLRSDFIAGMINQNDRFIVVLDMNCILSTQELEALVQLEHGDSSLPSQSKFASAI